MVRLVHKNRGRNGISIPALFHSHVHSSCNTSSFTTRIDHSFIKEAECPFHSRTHSSFVRSTLRLFRSTPDLLCSLRLFRSTDLVDSRRATVRWLASSYPANGLLNPLIPWNLEKVL
ncbi:hypothetical protein F0562_029268 [Nyssa sinensis]|uniref:Uncharacterized protein n=1 Tax=Nyssa sinensis TaxID=561372 RepID=A0A5J5B2K3_9ASTE|nr:hypothetical protein F0562_029268 [Nyssa sinensis]